MKAPIFEIIVFCFKQREMKTVYPTVSSGEAFSAYWSTPPTSNDIRLTLNCQGLTSQHIAPFRGHESKVTELVFWTKMCKAETDERMLWTLTCNCSRLRRLYVDSSNNFIMNHIHWSGYRHPVCRSLKSICIYCREVDGTTMARLVRAVETASVLCSLGIRSGHVDHSDITRLFLGDNQLKDINLSSYRFNEAECLALLLSSLRTSQWKVLRVRPHGSNEPSRFSLFVTFLRLASKSPAKMGIHGLSDLRSMSEVKKLMTAAVGNRVILLH